MVQRSENLRFTTESGEAFRITGELFGQDLDRNIPLQLDVASPIHLAHSAGAEQVEHFI